MSIYPWYWRSLPLEQKTASQVFEKLFFYENNICTLLESPANISTENTQLARYSICAGTPRIINGKMQMWTPQMGEILPFLHQLLKSANDQTAKLSNYPSLPFTGGWLGWLGYDLAWEIENLPKKNHDPLPFPIAYWYEPENFAILDHGEQKLYLAATNPQNLDQLESKLNQEIFFQIHVKNPNNDLKDVIYHTSQEQYENAVKKAKKYIYEGDIFQTNLSLRFSTETTEDSWSIYKKLHEINPSPFANYWRTPWGEVISCSPERLVLLKDNIAETRPIAGTRSRGKTPKLDQQLAEELLSNTKERAEHIMLVDLERNDLGKVCAWGTVEVNELLTIEKYSHVMHLVSNVQGKIKPELEAIDLIKAVFPGGTITGCPKVRCMEIIEELEPVSRNLFYGSCGYLDWRGNLDLNIFIRTLLYNNHQVWGQVGAGIVADSDPEKEWHESLHKAQAQILALQNNS